MNFSAVTTLGWVAWLMAVAETIRTSGTAVAPRRQVWRIAVIVAFLALRWPLANAPYEQNPDEGVTYAGARTLAIDPVYFRSVVGFTSGPLNYYAFVPSAAFTLDGNPYLGPRLFGNALLLGIAFGVGYLVRRAGNRFGERATVILLLTAYALGQAPDLQHASTEILPLFLVTMAAMVYVYHREGNGALAFAGIALGLVPWAKLQVAPLAAVMGLIFVLTELQARRFRAAAWLLGAAVLPSLVYGAVLRLGGRWEDMWTTYLVANTQYGDASRYTTLSALRGLFAAMTEDGQAIISLGTSLLVVVLALVAARGAPLRRRAWLYAVGAVLLGFFSIATSRRPFLHYWHLLAVPLSVLAGLAWSELSYDATDTRPRRWSIVLFVALLLPCVIFRAVDPRRLDWVRTIFERYGNENRELAQLVRPFVRPGDRLAVWGYRHGTYVATGLPQAVRFAGTEMQIRPGPLQSRSLQEWWEDFATKRPAIFADATGPGNLGFDFPNQPHEAFPPVAKMVRENYTLLADRFGVRIFVRNDRAPARP